MTEHPDPDGFTMDPHLDTASELRADRELMADLEFEQMLSDAAKATRPNLDKWRRGAGGTPATDSTDDPSS